MRKSRNQGSRVHPVTPGVESRRRRNDVLSIAFCSLVFAFSFAGCRQQVSRELPTDLDRLATSPGPGAVPVARPWVAAAIDATGGMDDWVLVEKLAFEGIVTAYNEEGTAYLTEHQFDLYPWLDAIQITAVEPEGQFVWQFVGGEERLLEGDWTLTVSPLSDVYRRYAEAVLQITTAPVRMVDRYVSVSRRPTPTQIGGQWYDPLEAKFRPRPPVRAGDPDESEPLVEPYWTEGAYFQNQDRLITDVIWLGNPIAQDYLVVRGYDYAPMGDRGVLVPAKIELFESGPDAQVGRRIALVDVIR